MRHRGGKHSSNATAIELVPFRLWGSNGWCNQEVVGESFNLPNLQRLFGRPTAKHREIETTALLIPEPDNPHDAAAVAVQIDGRTIGHLPREIAAGYQTCLAELAAGGKVAEVACRVWGGMVTDYETNRAGRLIEQERFTASVTVALAEPHLCSPVNEPPEVAHLLLPDGAAIQISGEDQCMPAIEPWLRPEGEAQAYATLHELSDTSGRAAKQLVEVRLAGQRVGQLTPKMSGDLLPAVRHLEGQGYVPVAKAKIKGNRLKAEITIQCAKAHELPSDWPGALAATEAPAVPAELAPAEFIQPAAQAIIPAHQSVEAFVAAGHGPIPPKPTRIKFAPAPGWPPPPEGWEPPPGWSPDRSWSPAPVGWQFWVME